MDTSTNRHCSEPLLAAKRLWRGVSVVNTRSSRRILAAASSGYGRWLEDSRSYSSIGAPMAEPPGGRSEPYMTEDCHVRFYKGLGRNSPGLLTQCQRHE
jgi:hypothetical protein